MFSSTLNYKYEYLETKFEINTNNFYIFNLEVASHYVEIKITLHFIKELTILITLKTCKKKNNLRYTCNKII